MKKNVCIRVFVLLTYLLVNMTEPMLTFGYERVISPTNREARTEVETGDFKLLVMLNHDLSTSSSKAGDCFSAKVLEDLDLEDTTIIPIGSTISGQVVKTRRSSRLTQSGKIVLIINTIKIPLGKTIHLGGCNNVTIVSSPYDKTYIERTVDRLPVSMASYGTSIPLAEATTLGGGAVYAISTGAALFVGLIAGAILPDYGKTRVRGACTRAIGCSPLGTITTAACRGREVCIEIGDCIVLTIDNDVAQGIYEQIKKPSS